MLALMPTLRLAGLSKRFRSNIGRCQALATAATKEDLSTLAGRSACTFGLWTAGKNLPGLEPLSQMCHQLNVSIGLLLRGTPVNWKVVEAAQESRAVLGHKSEMECRLDDREQALLAALGKDPRPTVAELARRLKCSSAETLRATHPAVCKQISANHRKHGVFGGRWKRLFCKADLEGALQRRLSQEQPMSVREIAGDLGYKCTGSVRRRCRELCRANARKREQNLRRGRKPRLVGIKNARLENPPPPLREIAQRLGFKSVMALVRAYAKACVAYKKWQRRRFAANRKILRMAIRSWLAEEREPTTAGFESKFGRSRSYLAAWFPIEYCEVVKRASKQSRLIREKRIEATREEVFRVARELRQKNVYPSVVRVSSLLGRDCITARRVVRSAIADARKALGSLC